MYIMFSALCFSGPLYRRASEDAQALQEGGGDGALQGQARTGGSRDPR